MVTWFIGIFNKHILRILMYGFIILGVGFFLYSAFLKPTNTTNIGSGGSQINVYGQESQRVPMFGCAAWRIQNETYWKKPIETQQREKYADKEQSKNSKAGN